MRAEEGCKGRLVEWVEKASFEKIRRMLEVSERECHYKVLLTLKNLVDVRRNPTCYNLPVILGLLASEVVVGEHFVYVDLLSLISSGASTFGGAKIEIGDRRSVAWSPSGSSASNSGGSRSAQPSLRRSKGGGPPEHLPLPSRGGKPTPQVIKVKKKKAAGQLSAPDTQVRDFIPWVRPESSHPPDLEEEEEEEMTGLLNRYVAKKRKQQEDAAREADAAPDQAVGSSRPTTGGSSKEQAIIILSSPETGSNDCLDIGDDILGEAIPTQPVLQTILPPAQVGIQSGRSEFTHTGLKRPKLPDRIITNSYLPARGPAPLKEEVSASGLEDIKRIVRRWTPFNQGESTADRLNSLYPVMLRMPVATRANGVGEDYSVTVHAGTNKEDLQQIIEDRIQIRNRNYIQPSELVR